MTEIPTLTASVGQGGANRRTDVLTVQALLNLVPWQLGGASPKLAVDGWIGPNTIGAIRHFQRAQFGWQDGRVDVRQPSITRLGQLRDALTTGSELLIPGTRARYRTAFGGDPLTGNERQQVLTTLRWLVLHTALGEAIPAPGKVSDQVTLPKDPDQRWPVSGPVRRGWERLLNYFQSAWGGAFDMRVMSCRQGIKSPGYRVRAPQEPEFDAKGKRYGVHWCGIFATWLYQQVLHRLPDLPFAKKRSLKFMPYHGITMPHNDRLRTHWHDIWPGDICVEVANSHHFIALNTPSENGMVWSVNGNSSAAFDEIDIYSDEKGWYSQSILVKQKSVIGLQRVYSADDLLQW